MITIEYGINNRLGNIMFMWSAAYVFAKKHGYYINMPYTLPRFKNKPEDKEPVDTGFGEANCSIQINRNCGIKHLTEPFVVVNNDNFLHLLKKDSVFDAHYHFVDYFQIKDFILEYENDIKELFIRKHTYREPQKVFVAVRLGDAINSRSRLPLKYYETALDNLYKEGCFGGHITSENIEHPDVQYLINKYNLSPYVNNTPLEKINFAKDFNNLVLSEGSFSFWIGFLSRANRVYVNNRRHLWSWHGDIFVNPNWRQLCFDTNN